MDKRELRERCITDPNTGCWLWTGAVSGSMKYGSVRHKGRVQIAHRVSWELTHGPIPKGLYVLHKCDTPPCANPDHLFLGTHRDNALDAAQKNRKAHGERNGATRLTTEQVEAIRRAGETQSAIARRFGTTQQTVSRIRRGRTWSKVGAWEPVETKGGGSE